MLDKPLREMTDEEIMARIEMLTAGDGDDEPEADPEQLN